MPKGYYKRSPEHLKKLHNQAINMIKLTKGKPISQEHKDRISKGNKGKRLGKHDLSPNPVTEEIKNGQSPYRYGVLVKRLLSPNNKCQDCNEVFELKKLQLHHEDIFNRQPETVDIKKLKVLCPKCHKQADMKIWKEYKSNEKVGSNA